MSSKSRLRYLLYRKIRWSENAEIVVIAFVVGAFSMILPWGSAFLWGPGAQLPSSEMSLNLIDLMTSSDLSAVVGAALFVIGLFLCIFSPVAVTVQIAGLLVLTFTMSVPLLHTLPPTPSGYTSSTSLAIGYFVGWLSVLIFGASLVKENALRWRRSTSRDMPASESLDIRNLGGARLPPQPPGET
jgi:hypothetical protein